MLLRPSLQVLPESPQNHKFQQRLERFSTHLDLNPGYWFDYLLLGRAYEAKGQFAQAIDAFQRGLKMDGNVELWSGLAHAYAASGNRVEALKVMEKMREMSATRYFGPYHFALVYAGLGDKEKAFEELEWAYQARSYLLVGYLNTDQRLDGLRGDPRFAALRQRKGLPTPQ